MKETTRVEIRNFMLVFARELTEIPFTIEELKKAFPFHTLFFPDEALVFFKQQRSIVTKMGMVLYPKIAETIARDQHHKVYPNYEITGRLEVAKINVIDRITNDLRAGGVRPDFNREVREILGATGGGEREVKIIADLFIEDFKPGPLFLEIKSPRPNLDVCAESKTKMLFFRALFQNRHPQAYLAFPYNPFICREKYSHGFTEQIMDIEKEVLIGEEMWDKLGGKGT